MHLEITGRHMQVSDALSDHVQEKLEQEIEGFPRMEAAHVILEIEKYRHCAEIVLQGPPRLRLEARAEEKDMYAAIDRAMEKIGRQLKRAHERLHEVKSRERISDATDAPDPGETGVV